jgi:hypothetical protein
LFPVRQQKPFEPLTEGVENVLKHFEKLQQTTANVRWQTWRVNR